MTLTVNDGNGHTATDTATANPTDPGGDPVSNIAFVGSASSNGNRQNHAMTLPGRRAGGRHAGAVLQPPAATPTYTGPAGWTLLESKDGTAHGRAGLDEDGDGGRRGTSDASA